MYKVKYNQWQKFIHTLIHVDATNMYVSNKLIIGQGTDFIIIVIIQNHISCHMHF